MAKYLVELTLDGYDSEEVAAKVGVNYIEENLDAAGVLVKARLIEPTSGMCCTACGAHEDHWIVEPTKVSSTGAQADES